MPTNANTFNSRVTSEALEKKFRDVFPAQGGAELVQDLYASGVITPVIDFSSVAEGSVLSQNLQTAWDFSTGFDLVSGADVAIVTNPGFWQFDLTATMSFGTGTPERGRVYIDDASSEKTIWQFYENIATPSELFSLQGNKAVVYLRSGDQLRVEASSASVQINIWYRQIADVNGNLVNPLGFTFS